MASNETDKKTQDQSSRILLMSNRGKLLIQNFAFYAAEHKDTLSELEALLKVNTQFRARKELAKRLEKVFASQTELTPNTQEQINKYQNAIELVLDPSQGNVPSSLFYKGTVGNPVQGQITSFPIAACLLQQTTAQYDKPLSFIHLLLLTAIILNPLKNYNNVADDIRLFTTQPRLPSVITDLLNNKVQHENFEETLLSLKAIGTSSISVVDIKFIDALSKIWSDSNITTSSKLVVESDHSGSEKEQTVQEESTPPIELDEYIQEYKQATSQKPQNSRRWIANLQRLTPNDYRVLLPAEKNRLATFLIKTMNENNEDRRIASGVIFIEYIIGQERDMTMDLICGKNGDLDDSKGIYHRKTSLPVKAYEPGDEVKGQQKRCDFVELPLPDALVQWMKRLPRLNGKLSDCINMSRNELDSHIKLLMDELRRPVYFNRIHSKKIPSALSLELTLLFRDESLTHLIAAKNSHDYPVVSYYIAHDVKFVQKAYVDAVNELLCISDTIPKFEVFLHNHIPSYLDAVTGYYPTKETIISLRKNAEKVLNKAKQSGDIFLIHNAYVDYCLLLLSFGTGHRPVEDPFPKYSHFILEDNLVAISDKVMSMGRPWRIVGLPSIAAKQVEYYYQYLHALVSKLQIDSNTEELANVLADQLLNQNVKLPFFFYLSKEAANNVSSIVKGSMEANWAKLWDWPANFPRHVVATELSKRSQCGELVKIQLGHNYDTSDHFGKFSTLAPKPLLKYIADILNTALDSFGWKAIKSPLRKTMPINMPKPSSLIIKKVFGYEKRSQKRAKKLRHASDLIRALVKKLFNKENFSRLSDEELEKLSKTVENDTEQEYEIQLKCLRLLNRYGRLLSKSTKNKNLQNGIPLKSEDSPFSESTLEDYRSSSDVRKNWIEYLNQQPKTQDFSIEYRMAEITVSAALCGGLLNKTLLEHLIQVLPSVLLNVGEHIFVDFSQHEKTKIYRQRWYPDSITSGLILGLLRQTQGCLKVSRKSRYFDALAKLLTKLQIPAPLSISLSFDKLIDIGTKLAILELPGFLRSYSTGDIPSVSLPLETVVRIKSDQALVPSIQDCDANVNDENLYWLPPLKQIEGNNSGIAVFKESFKKYNAIAQNIDYGGVGNRNRKLKAKLLAMLTANFSEHNQEWGLTSRLAAGFCITLIQEGTLLKKDAAYKTITGYTFHIIRFLHKYEEKTNLSLTDCYDVDWETIYIDALESGTKKEISNAANILHQFHLYLSEKHGFDEIDWSQIYAVAGKNFQGANIDANYLSENEYLYTLESIITSPQIDPWKRNQIALLLMFGYRGSLRIGEAHGLLYRDVIKGIKMALIVKQNIVRGLKSKAGRRVVTFDEKLKVKEENLLNQYLDSIKIDVESDNIIPLFRNIKANKREIISRSYATQVIHHFLRAITGDPSMRYHHSRHTHVSKNVLTQIQPVQYDSKKQQEPLSNIHFFPLREIVTDTGHASELTTLVSYCHSLDSLLPKWLSSFKSQLADSGRAYVLSMSYDSIRKKRLNLDTSNLFASVSNKSIVKLIRQPDYKLRPRHQNSLSEILPKYKKNLSIIDIENILRRYVFSTKSPEAFALSLSLPPAVINQVLEIAAVVERESGFERYKLNVRQSKREVTRDSDTLASTRFSKAEVTELREHINRASLSLSAHREDKDLVREALNAWCTSYCAAKASNLIQNSTQYQQLTFLSETFVNNPSVALNFESKERQVNSGYIVTNNTTVNYQPLPKTHEKIKCLQHSTAEFRIKFPFQRKVVMTHFYIMYVYFRFCEANSE